MHKKLTVLYCALLLSVTMPAVAAKPLEVEKNETIMSMLQSKEGKRVSIALVSGTELTGIIKTVNKRVLHLSTLSGKEYFDAIVNIDFIEAIIVRVK